jgi:hypothetical protein
MKVTLIDTGQDTMTGGRLKLDMHDGTVHGFRDKPLGDNQWTNSIATLARFGESYEEKWLLEEAL